MLVKNGGPFLVKTDTPLPRRDIKLADESTLNL